MISQVDSKLTCIHALGAVPKNSGGIRHITDCSRPDGISVNYHCETLLEEFCFKNVEDVVAILGQYDHMCVVDIKAAYRAVPILEEHRSYQGFSWVRNGETCWFEDNRLCFGLRLGPMYFNFLSTFIYDILTMKGLNVVNYLDDFIAVSDNRDECVAAQNEIVGLLRYLGFNVSFGKLVHPSTCVTYLGIEIDSEKMELRLPPGKLAKIKCLVSNALSQKRISKKELESLGGSLSHCSHVVKGGRVFCKGVYSLYRSMIAQGKRFINIPDWVKADLRWWDRLCSYFNGICKMVKFVHEHAMVSDASFKGYMASDWCAGVWDLEDNIPLTSVCNHVAPPPFAVNLSEESINVLELWPVLVGVKRWSHLLRNRSVVIFTDNTQVLFMLLNGKSSNVICMQWIRELFWICAIFNINIIVRGEISARYLVVRGRLGCKNWSSSTICGRPHDYWILENLFFKTSFIFSIFLLPWKNNALEDDHNWLRTTSFCIPVVL